MPTHNDDASISRATSRRSGAGSNHSRAKSLIQKNTAASDLRPSDVLIERFVAWKAIVKQLVAYFEVRPTRPSYRGFSAPAYARTMTGYR